MFLYKRSVSFFLSYFYVLVITCSFFVYSMDHYPVQRKIPSTNMSTQQKQDTFNHHVRDLNANMLGCLHSLTTHIDSTSDFKECEDMESEFDKFGVFLNKNEKDAHGLLKNPENAANYFNTKQHMQEIIRLMSRFSHPTVVQVTERVSGIFQMKHEPFDEQYIILQKPIIDDPEDGPFPLKIKAFQPLIWVTTYFAPKKYLEQLTRNDTKKDSSVKDNSTTETERLIKTITQDPDIWTKDDMKESNFLLFYKGVNPCLTLFFEERLRAEDATLFDRIKKTIPLFAETADYENNTKKDDDNDMFKIAVKEQNDLMGKVVNSKRRKQTFLVLQKIMFQYLQTPLSVFQYVFKPLPTYDLKKDYFNEEIDYRFYLFFQNPFYKVDLATRNNSFGPTRSVLGCEINRFVPKLKDLEKKVEAAKAVGAKYVHTREDIELCKSATDYCYILLYAQVCDTLWKAEKGEFMWDRTTNPSVFAGFSEKTIHNIDYMYTLFSSKQKNK